MDSWHTIGASFSCPPVHRGRGSVSFPSWNIPRPCRVIAALVILPQPAFSTGLPWREHQVRGEETLFSVACRYGVSTESTARANEQSLSTSTLQESRVLLVPKRSSDVVSTFVEVRARKRGETVVPQLRERRNTSVVRPAPPPGGGTVAKKESFILPVAGQITSPYGKRASRFHDGIDIPAAVGPLIVAVKSGRVVFSGSQNGFGKTVTIDHGDGTITRYSHNSVNLVKKGDTVLQGQPIAKIGRTGRSTCDHLHLTLWVHGKKVNPAKYFPY